MTIAFGDERLPRRYWDKVQVDAVSGCWLWTASKINGGYGQFRIDGKMKLAHRVMMHAIGVDSECFDHICKSRNCVNPEHLRPATNRENSRYKTSAKDSTSRFLGVSRKNQTGKWRSQARIGDLRPDNRRELKHIGYFATEEEAARAYDRAVKAFYGEFVALNFPEDAGC